MAFCENCGCELTGQEQFCEKCGCYVQSQDNVCSQMQTGRESTDLKGSLIYRMSNGSHELFHSNVIAWMLERNHDFAGVFFDELRGQSYEVSREKNHMDIVLDVGGKAYVIENKFKSLPSRSQLERYQQTFNKTKPIKQFGGGVLLGVHDVLGNACPQKWHYVDYREIADYIDNSIARVPCDDKKDFEHLTVIQYGWLIRQLKERLEQEIDWEGKKMPSPSDFASLEGIQLRDLCKKIQTAVFANRLSQQIDEERLNQYASKGRLAFNFKITTSFLRGDAILEARFFKDSREESEQKKDVNWGADCTIGVEVHANKYMWFIKCDEDTVPANKVGEIIDMLKAQKWFTDDSRMTVSGNPQKKGLYSFGREFKYQYLPLKDEVDFSFKSLSDRIREKIEEAKGLLPLLNEKLNERKNKHGVL